MPQFPHSKYSASPSAGVFVKCQGSHSPMVEADISEFVAAPVVMEHPFKVTNLGVEDTDAGSVFKFKLFVGHVFGIRQTEAQQPWTTDVESIVVENGDLTATPDGIVSPGILDERNTTTVYSANLDTTQVNILYVKIEREDPLNAVYTASVSLKTFAESQHPDDGPAGGCLYDEELLVGASGHESVGDTPTNHLLPDLETEVGFYPFTLRQRMDKYVTMFSFHGSYRVPIATITLVGSQWVVRQLLRSDIFFPYGLPYQTCYVDTTVYEIDGGCVAV